MCKVYEFLTKKEFPENLEERLDKVVRELVTIMNEGLDNLYGDEPTEEEYADFMDSMVIAYNELLEKAIHELV
jgi:hypothetical protein